MEETSKAKWIVIGGLVLAVVVAMVLAKRSYEEPLHMNARQADHVSDRLKPIRLGEDDGAVVLALPKRKNGGNGTNPAVAVGAFPERLDAAGPPRRFSPSGPWVTLNTNHWLTGTVRLGGTPPPARPLPMDADCSVAAKKLNDGRMPTTRDFVMGPNGGLADVVVTIEGFKGRVDMPTPPILEYVIEGCQLRPKVAACMIGQTLRIRNRDGEVRSVQAMSQIPGNAMSENLLLPGAPSPDIMFLGPEENLRITVAELKWADAFVTVQVHPYFAVTDSDGAFRFPLPPKGSYRLKAFHRKLDPVSRELTIEADADRRSDFRLVYRD